MADSQEIKTISRTNTGFPSYLDFGKLRSSGITYLGKISGKIWTDHNAHDPGITILETLIYAMLDLGYRTHLPVNDLFAVDPTDKSGENNFFSPSHILGNNPLTITDIRKLLVDISGVKNAWVEIDEETKVDFCGNTHRSGAAICDCDKINGLYHVYVQPEEYLMDADGEDELEALLFRIRRTLFQHRNLCEDFVDIKIVCTLKIGICADLEIGAGDDVEDVYLHIVSAVKEYFCPSPKFYTLSQLIDKGRTVDEIYAGRPFDLEQSHGFLDAEEFEMMERKKVLHLSDLYNVLFNISGITNVRNLGWIKCCDKPNSKSDPSMVFSLPPDHIPVFSPECSGFRFFRSGLPLQVDARNFNYSLDSSADRIYKGAYRLPSPFFEPEYPKGNYRADLAEYLSIQNELPKVYGITEGGLPVDVPVERKAQARQLQGFLLFFDQLLANYLTQLKNIRSLFALRSSDDKKNNHTYFLNKLTDAPYLNELVRFSTEEGLSGTEGNVLAYPTSRKKLQKYIDEGELRITALGDLCGCDKDEDFPEYRFCFAAERDQAILQLQADIINNEFEPVIVSTVHDCYFFYFFCSSPDFAIISKNYYRNEQETRNAAFSVKYTGSYETNYHRFMTSENHKNKERFSFDIELSMNSYSEYLQQIIEDEDLYLARRQDFLSHLLSRFAERFTDYALLSAGILSPQQIKNGQIRAEEKFLTHYESISGNRGRAYNYMLDGWNVDNTSGFEKRFKALAGIQNWDRHYLCNFIVEKADEQFRLLIRLFDATFSTDKVFDRQNSLFSLKSIYTQLADHPALFAEATSDPAVWKVVMKDEYKNEYILQSDDLSEDEANEKKEFFQNALSYKPSKNANIDTTETIFRVYLCGKGNSIVGASRQTFKDPGEADYFLRKAQENLDQAIKEKQIKPSQSIPHNWLTRQGNDDRKKFISEELFDFKSPQSYHLNGVRNRFTLLNTEREFQFDSVGDFEGTEQAKDMYRKLLVLMHRRESYAVEKDLDENMFKIFVKQGDQIQAVYFQKYESDVEGWDKIDEIIDWLNDNTYTLSVSDPIGTKWKFIYYPVSISGERLIFKSKTYKDEKQVWIDAEYFHDHIHLLHLSRTGNALELAVGRNGSMIRMESENIPDEKISEAERIVTAQMDTLRSIKHELNENFKNTLEGSRINKNENYIYKLVDKDKLMAYCPLLHLSDKKIADKNRKKLISRGNKAYNYLDIIVAGDEIIKERTNTKTKAKRYHYLVVCNNIFYKDESSGKRKLVLFESVTGYASKADAFDAFTKMYLVILKKALNELNYGPGKPISFIEIISDDTGSCDLNTGIVFIPKDTIDHFGGYEVQRFIISVVRTYPVRLSAKKYRFVVGYFLHEKPFSRIDWCSKPVYDDAGEAMSQFLFLLVLLKYSGNYHIERDLIDCSYRLFIREVLAVSANGFESAEQAWGANGVERFICTAQSTGSFHHYLRDGRTGSHSFYVSCGSSGLIHPCTYESPERRDKMMHQLFKARHFHFFELIGHTLLGDLILFNYRSDKSVALQQLLLINVDNHPYVQLSPCETLIKLFSLVHNPDNFVVEQDKVLIRYKVKSDNKDNKYHILAESMMPGTDKAMLQQELIKIAGLFPVQKKKDKYYVSFRLPGLNNYYRDNLASKKKNDCDISCDLAWQSDCCFDSCDSAIEYYNYAWGILQLREHYKQVYDCECYSYSIKILPRFTDDNQQVVLDNITEKMPSIRKLQSYRTLKYGRMRTEASMKVYRHFKCLPEIIAINPQLYSNEKMSCDAGERSRKLINSEGLHLVEHILLRPRCERDGNTFIECDCQALPRPYVPGYNNPEKVCHFEWKQGGEPDQCEKKKEICFTPGCDPFSFIVTVALPNWPQRFRTASGREIVEKLLHRQTPAHILTRILWLNPRDFCCFEQYFKLWGEWMAQKPCTSYSVVCRFLNFLFRKGYALPSDIYNNCRECVPCRSGNRGNGGCFEEVEDPCAGYSLTAAINDLYGWNYHNRSSAGNFDYQFCEPANIPDTSDNLEKGIVINSRSNKYFADINGLKVPDQEDESILRAEAYLRSSHASLKKYTDHINSLLLQSPDSDQSAHTRYVLIRNITFKFLDLACVDHLKNDELDLLARSFSDIHQTGIDTEALFNEWKAYEVMPYFPSTDFNKIHSLLSRH